jgi:hypothetical protein
MLAAVALNQTSRVLLSVPHTVGVVVVLMSVPMNFVVVGMI